MRIELPHTIAFFDYPACHERPSDRDPDRRNEEIARLRRENSRLRAEVTKQRKSIEKLKKRLKPQAVKKLGKKKRE